MTFRARLRAARLATGLSQSELARRIHVRPSAINHMESGRVHTVMADTLVRLAQELGVNPIWLRDGTGPPQGDSLTPDESEAVSVFRALSESDRAVWVGVGKLMLSRAKP